MKNKLKKITLKESQELNCGDVVLEEGDSFYIELKEGDYGWEIRRGKEFDALDEFVEYVGEKSALDQLAQAMGTDELGENLAFIFRQNDFSDSSYLK